MFDKNKIYAELASQGRARQEMPQIASGYNPKGGGGFFDDISKVKQLSEWRSGRNEARLKRVWTGGSKQQRETDLAFGETHVGGRGGGGRGGGRGDSAAVAVVVGSVGMVDARVVAAAAAVEADGVVEAWAQLLELLIRLFNLCSCLQQ